ncbi:hypothetical protein T10_9589 [Trichinella papuae]|uniref:Uncharacterized protein n=1 Tax=Trichinella papuae TaxID=268474 RepID=A0A0V1MT18_9BILA|nr:hypothetical protein T10_9589 [Trichinella papuae]
MISLCNCIMLGFNLSSQRVKVKIWGLRGAVDASNMAGWKNSGSTLASCLFLRSAGCWSAVLTSSRNEDRGAAEQSKRNKDRRVTTAKETRVHKNERTFSFQAEEVYLARRASLNYFDVYENNV